ncbi:LOW QUALITY PROTEIN: pleckstrin homology domain-containing family F member 2-like [Lingula anatina]|uniref:LOW QUALITY PROTEIN: pleckstrin homology domain-containing family F member 2-like n=1 Tax=Lingula anatina TaxID=7574 RepID=A0A1S3IFL5_LINAN|nr:LOW QUALITY PROTEIN: pleckstrin homology domain-containing family F member 2-like [Lingula anatina]|eukprot:XP_013397022.1 LOW QUALITY PROTEIN: pleckstrin homology domain-containing family F member 2-like [Lingula anatina]
MVDRLVNSDANNKRIAFVEQCFGSSGQPLTVPGRVLVGEGVLTKMCRKRPKPRQFFLFNDILVYGNIVINKKKYNKQHILPLEDVKLQSVEDEGSLRNGWQIISPSKSFTVYAATATEKAEWMAHINKCVQDLLAKRGKKHQAVDDSPVWIPDSEASKCMQCNRVEFSILNRRHHCRKCGRVVCNPCSSKKWLLPQQSSKPLRVCLNCYDQLAASGSRPDDRLVTNAGSQESSGEDSSDDDDDEEDTPTVRDNEPSFYQ